MGMITEWIAEGWRYSRDVTRPFWGEFFFYLLLAGLLVVMVLFYRHSRIQNDIMRNSACYSERIVSAEPAVYQVTGRYMNTPAFNVTYDTEKKTQKLSCACPAGNNKGTFTKIPYYDMNTTADGQYRIKYVDSLVCDCEQTMNAAADDPKMTYTGERGVANFMYDTQNTGFFDSIFIGSNAEYNTSSVTPKPV